MQARIFSSTLKFKKVKNLKKIQKVINLQTATLKHQQAKTTHSQTSISRLAWQFGYGCYTPKCIAAAIEIISSSFEFNIVKEKSCCIRQI